MKSTGLILVGLSFAVCACSATATVVSKDQGHGRIALTGPYMPAMRDARTLMLEQCKGRFHTLELGESVMYRCANAEPLVDHETLATR